MRTESSELSGEEGFLPTTAGKTRRSLAFSGRFWRQITDLKQLFGLKNACLRGTGKCRKKGYADLHHIYVA